MDRIREASRSEYNELTKMICSMDPWKSLQINQETLLSRWNADTSRTFIVCI